MTARYRSEILCACLLLLMGANMLVVVHRKSLTNDEYYGVAAGYYHLVQGNFTISQEHPPFGKTLSALPLLFLRPEPPAVIDRPDETPITRGIETFAAFWSTNMSRADSLSFWVRVPMVLLTMVLGALIFVFTRDMFGTRAGILSVVLFIIEPTILAHGRVAYTDTPSALGYLLFFFALRKFSRAPDWRRALGVGAALGFALITKFSLLVLFPLFVIAAVVMLWRARHSEHQPARLALRIAVALLVTLFLINAAYYFKREPLSPADAQWVATNSPSHSEAVLKTIRCASAVLPTSFVFGGYVLWAHNHMGHPAGLLGDYRLTGWWYYFPVAFSLKTTIPFLLLSLAAIGWAVWSIWRRRDGTLLWLIGPIFLYTVLAMNSQINIGIRHLLPVFPFLFILGGAFLDSLLRMRAKRIASAVVLALLCWMGVEAVRAFPNYLTYMNEIASQHPHWYYLSDSNVEWGDDTKAMASYLCEHGETRVRVAILGGWTSRGVCSLEFVNAYYPDSAPTPTRYVAIGASFLNGSTVPFGLKNTSNEYLTEEQRHNFFARYRDRRPEAVFGNSIYLYREE